jgi:hypothetical protein
MIRVHDEGAKRKWEVGATWLSSVTRCHTHGLRAALNNCEAAPHKTLSRLRDWYSTDPSPVLVQLSPTWRRHNTSQIRCIQCPPGAGDETASLGTEVREEQQATGGRGHGVKTQVGT